MPRIGPGVASDLVGAEVEAYVGCAEEAGQLQMLFWLKAHLKRFVWPITQFVMNPP